MADNLRDREFDPPVNPYAPPEVDLTAEYHRGKGMTGFGKEPFSASLVIGRSWEIYKQRMGLVIGVVLTTIFLNYAFQFGSELILESIGRNTPAGALVVLASTLGALFLQFWLICGQSLVLLKVARGEYAEFSELFRGGPYLVRYFLATLVLGIIFMGMFAGCAAPVGMIYLIEQSTNSTAFLVAVGLGILAAFIAALILSARLYQYSYLIIDRESSAMQSLQQSWELTRGKTVELIGLSIVTGIIGLMGFLMCLVGAIFTLPLCMLIMACTYVALSTGLPKDFYLATEDHERDTF